MKRRTVRKSKKRQAAKTKPKRGRPEDKKAELGRLVARVGDEGPSCQCRHSQRDRSRHQGTPEERVSGEGGLDRMKSAGAEGCFESP